MAKVTSKLQLTLPKALAEQFGVQPGDEVEWVAADDTIRLVLARRRSATLDTSERLRLFDQATLRQAQRQEATFPVAERDDRGWTREDLYDRDRAD